MRHTIIAGVIVAGAVLAAGGFVVFQPTAPDAGEAGVFENDCCGTVTLSDGKMLVNGRMSIHYSVGRDSEGPYVLPKTYVGVVLDQGLEVDGYRSLIKLRLDRLPRPMRITLYEGMQPYDFKRTGSQRRRT